MLKIVTTKHYKNMELAIELGDLLLELAEKVMKRQEVRIDELEIKLAESEMTPRDNVKEECVKVYKLDWKPDQKKQDGVAFKGTKKELDKFIQENSYSKRVKHGRYSLKYKEFTYWMSLGKKKRKPKTMAEFAKMMNVSQSTLTAWNKKLLSTKKSKKQKDEQKHSN